MFRFKSLRSLSGLIRPKSLWNVRSTSTQSNLVNANASSVSKNLRLSVSIEKRLARYNQEIDLGKGPVMVRLDDALLSHIIRADCFDDVRALIRANFNIMNNEHVAQCLQTIHNLIRYSHVPDDIKFEIISSKEFSILANRTLKIARHLLPSECLLIYQVLRTLDISVDTTLCQAMLQMIRYSINEYSIPELYRLSKILPNSPQSKSTLPSAIQLALPIAVKHRIEQKEVNFRDHHHLLTCLELIALCGCDRFDDETLLQCLVSISKCKTSYWNLNDSLALMSHLFSLKIQQDSEHAGLVKSLVSQCIANILAKKQTESIPQNYFYATFAKLKNNLWLYDPRLSETVCLHAIDNESNLSIEDLYKLVQMMINFRHVNYPFLKLLAKRIEENCNDLSGVTIIFRLFTLATKPDSIHDNLSQLAYIAKQSKAYDADIKRSSCNHFIFLRHCILLGVNVDAAFIGDVCTFERFLRKASDEATLASRRYNLLKTITEIYRGLTESSNVQLDSELSAQITQLLEPFVEEFRHVRSQEGPSFNLDQGESITNKILNHSELAQNQM